MSIFFDFLKFSLPALILVAGIYFTLNKISRRVFHYIQYNLDKPTKSNQSKLLLQAYERLALLCERIQPDRLAQRLQSPDLTAKELSQSMIVTIQQEFDHNISQQIYISESLWAIISLAKDEAIYEIIQKADLYQDQASTILTESLMKDKADSRLNIALQAIRKEAKMYVKS